MAVPKKKTARSASKVRHSHYVQKNQKRLLNTAHVVSCSQCGAAKQSHRVCPECGTYKGRDILKKQKQEAVRVQA